MRTPVDVFNDACATRWLDSHGRIFGTRLDTQFETEEDRVYLELFRQSGTNGARATKHHFPGIMDIQFDYLTSPQLNAIADVIDDPIIGKMGYVAMFRGTPLLLRDMFWRMLAHPNVLKSFGESQNEVVNSQHSEGVAVDFSELQAERAIAGRSVETIRPKCFQRELLATGLTMNCLDFLVSHEITHIVNGHCEYLQKLSAPAYSPFVIEAKAMLGTFDIALTRQALEQNADVMGAFQTLRVALLMSKSDAFKNHPATTLLWAVDGTPQSEKVTNRKR